MPVFLQNPGCSNHLAGPVTRMEKNIALSLYKYSTSTVKLNIYTLELLNTVLHTLKPPKPFHRLASHIYGRVLIKMKF